MLDQMLKFSVFFKFTVDFVSLNFLTVNLSKMTKHTGTVCIAIFTKRSVNLAILAILFTHVSVRLAKIAKFKKPCAFR